MTDQTPPDVILDTMCQAYYGVSFVECLKWANDALTSLRTAPLSTRLAFVAMVAPEVVEAMEPFVSKSAIAVAEAEEIRTEFAGFEDTDRIEEQYSWAMALTWGDLRLARDLVAQMKEAK